jgi:polysaccharide biosynthesis protein PelC
MNGFKSGFKRRFKSGKHLASWCVAALAASVLLAGCGTLRQTAAPTLGAGDPVAVATIANYTETPSAGSSAASIAASVLRTNGLKDVRFAPADAGSNALFDTAQREGAEQKLEWAQSQQVKYVLTGAVEEWRYKTGVDGEPVVGLTLELIDVQSGQVVWSATGARSGWSRSSLSSVATSLIGSVLAPLAPRH